MPQHVYLARPGFSQEPIDHARWLDAARQVPALQVRDHPSAQHGLHHDVLLADDPSQQLQWSAKGLAVARSPSREMVAAMFALAAALQAGVYSESRRAYASVEDWALRSERQARRRRQADAAGAETAAWADPRWRRRFGLALGMLLLLALCIAVAVQLGSGAGSEG